MATYIRRGGVYKLSGGRKIIVISESTIGYTICFVNDRERFYKNIPAAYIKGLGYATIDGVMTRDVNFLDLEHAEFVTSLTRGEFLGLTHAINDFMTGEIIDIKGIGLVYQKDIRDLSTRIEKKNIENVVKPDCKINSNEKILDKDPYIRKEKYYD